MSEQVEAPAGPVQSRPNISHTFLLHFLYLDDFFVLQTRCFYDSEEQPSGIHKVQRLLLENTSNVSLLAAGSQLLGQILIDGGPFLRCQSCKLFIVCALLLFKE